MARALALASSLLLAPQAFKLRRSLVGLPFSSFSGPGMLPIRAKKLARLGLSPLFTGGLNFPSV